MTNLRVADLFCGAGGLSLGFRLAGLDVVYAADHDADSIRTYRENLGDHAHHIDLSKGSARSLANQIVEAVGTIDLLIGGPPCQGFSVQRRGDVEDDRNDLLLRHVRIGVALNAKAILIENVPAVLGARGRSHINAAVVSLERAGYGVEASILQAADYGVPQLRKRAFIVALKRNQAKNPFEFPPATLAEHQYVTVRKAFENLPEPPQDYLPHRSILNHQRRKISALNLERLSYVPEGGGRLDVPLQLRLPCHSKEDGHRHLDVYGRMWWDRPAPTITAMFDNFTRGRFAHPAELRNITNREGARLQSFPDSFAFFGDQKSVARQIGNAVPPLLACEVAKAIQRSLTNAREEQIGERTLLGMESVCCE